VDAPVIEVPETIDVAAELVEELARAAHDTLAALVLTATAVRHVRLTADAAAVVLRVTAAGPPARGPDDVWVRLAQARMAVLGGSYTTTADETGWVVTMTAPPGG